MQIDAKLYDPSVHDIYTALTVKQPYADLLTQVEYRDTKGEYHARKMVEVRSRDTKYRGDLLICSSAKPELAGRMAGVTCGFVELYYTKRVEDFTAEDWAATCIPENARPHKGFGWFMRNPRRVIEMPIKGKLGLYRLVVPKGDITEYPRTLYFGRETINEMRKKL